MNKRQTDKMRKARRKRTGIKLTAILAFMVMVSSSVYFSGGTPAGFFKAFGVETGIVLLAAAGLAVYIVLNENDAGRSTAAVMEKKTGMAADHSSQAEHRLKKLSSGNFNWIIDEKPPEVPIREASAQAKTASVLFREDPPRKYFPYRSPFDRINPPREKEEPVETPETTEPCGAPEAPEASEQGISNQELLNSSAASSGDKKSPRTVAAGKNEVNAAEIVLYEVKDETAESLSEHMDIASEENVGAGWYYAAAGNNEETEKEDDYSKAEAEDKEADCTAVETEDEEVDYTAIETEDEVEDYAAIKTEDEEENYTAIGDDNEDRNCAATGADDEEDDYTELENGDGEEDCFTAVNDGEEGNFTAVSGNERQEKDYTLPPAELLRKSENGGKSAEQSLLVESNAVKLVDTLQSFGVGASVVNISIGPAVTRYEVQPNVGVKVSKIVNLADDIALNLAATGVRIEAPIPGKAAVGIEVPNREVTPVLLRDVIESEEFRNYPSKLAFAVGKDIAGKTVVADIAKMPHLLIAGATGSGKSVCINTLIASILYKALPSEVKLLLVDPKVVELGIYNGIPHLLIPVVTDPKKAAGALNWAVLEMTSRYKLFADNNVRDIKGYNAMVKQKGTGDFLPHIVIIIDELADLMMAAPGEVEDSICRLAQMARAAGMHLVIATQRPSVDVITGVIKANIPSRISFAVSSQIDSRTILDMAGAEKLLGRGDMLFSPVGKHKPLRVQGAFISDKEVEDIVAHTKASMTGEYDHDIMEKIEKHGETPQVDGSGDDELLPQAIEMVIEMDQASASLIQRKFKVGYSRAARIVDQMEAWGVVGPPEGSKPRQILITRQQWDELNT